jgi:hypothetical protein
LLKVTGGNAYATSDVGQHQMFAAQYYAFDAPRRWINWWSRDDGLRLAGRDGCSSRFLTRPLPA